LFRKTKTTVLAMFKIIHAPSISGFRSPFCVCPRSLGVGGPSPTGSFKNALLLISISSSIALADGITPTGAESSESSRLKTLLDLRGGEGSGADGRVVVLKRGMNLHTASRVVPC
jgi:hypothetical protein